MYSDSGQAYYSKTVRIRAYVFKMAVMRLEHVHHPTNSTVEPGNFELKIAKNQGYFVIIFLKLVFTQNYFWRLENTSFCVKW